MLKAPLCDKHCTLYPLFWSPLRKSSGRGSYPHLTDEDGKAQGSKTTQDSCSPRWVTGEQWRAQAERAEVPDPISCQVAADSAELGFWHLLDLEGVAADAQRKPLAIDQAKASSVATAVRKSLDSGRKYILLVREAYAQGLTGHTAKPEETRPRPGHSGRTCLQRANTESCPSTFWGGHEVPRYIVSCRAGTKCQFGGPQHALKCTQQPER